MKGIQADYSHFLNMNCAALIAFSCSDKPLINCSVLS